MELIESLTGLSSLSQFKVFSSLLTILILWIINYSIIRFGRKSINSVKKKYQFRKTSSYIFVIIGILLIGRIWLQGFKTLTTFLGLVSAGIAIALKDIITNIAGFGFILWRRPFKAGDRIEIGEVAGDVIDLRFFQFTILEIGNWVDADQSTGRIIHIPNGEIFKVPLKNYEQGFSYIWDEIVVLITFESDWKKAKKIIEEIINKDSEKLAKQAKEKVKEKEEKFMIFYKNLTPIVYTSVKDSGVELTARYLCEPRQRRTRQQEFWEAVLDKFSNECDIDFAYPTQRFFMENKNIK